MREGFYRSRLFWLGVPGLVFLLWVWWDSGRYRNYAEWTRGKQDHVVWVVEGYVRWVATTRVDSTSVKNSFYYDRTEWKGGWFEVRQLFSWHSGSAPDIGIAGLVKVEVALWGVVAGYGVMWLGAVWWWQRRKLRVMKREGEMVGERQSAG
jgi:hypothetical protein